MSVEIGTEAAQFPEKEYTNGIFLAVYSTLKTFRLVWLIGFCVDAVTETANDLVEL